MAIVKIPKGWEIPERLATPEHVYLNRRKFLAALGTAAVGAAVIPGRDLLGAGTATSKAGNSPYPAKRNPAYQLDRPITDEIYATRYNNFVEFSDQKEMIWKLVDRFQTDPWTITISGLVNKPQTVDVSQLIRKFGVEERLYRHRCVDAWAMAVPWTGFPFKALIDWVQPVPEARYVRLVSFVRPDEAPAQKEHPKDPWPHTQGLTIAEAMNELTLITTGLYGHELPKQNGAPIRVVVPWKYGFKSLKSIVAIEFTAQQPGTHWNNLILQAHHFVANVDPNERYMEQSQAHEKILGGFEVRPTLLYNGYGSYVSHLYDNPQQG